MNPVDITRRTRAIGAPVNWDQKLDGECGVLCVRDETDVQSGHNTMVSAWMPSETEMQMLQNGLPILLTIFGSVHPVVAMGVGTPADQPKEPPCSDQRLMCDQ